MGSSFNEFLSEKQKFEDFLVKLETDLNACLDDFEKVTIEKLSQINEDINDSEAFAIVISPKLYEDFTKFKNEFNYFVSSFEEVKLFKVETTLDDFINRIQQLQKDLYD